MTGTYCPGCGGLRAVNDLTHGDVAAAASSNLAFVATIPVFAVLWARSFRQRWTGAATPMSQPVVLGLTALAVVVIVLFWVLRNLPGLGWLAP
jgi:hypothetical protein